MCDGGMVGPEAFRSLGLEADAIRGKVEQLCHPLANFRGVRSDLWCQKNERRIDARNPVTGGANTLQGFPQKDRGIRALPPWIRGRKQRADIRRGNGPEQCIGKGVQQHVAIGMAAKAVGMRESNASDCEANAGFKFVRIPTITNAGKGL